MNIYPYFLGRNALFAAGSHLKSCGYSSILMPAYCCGDEIEVFIRLGFEVDFYDVYFDVENGFFAPNKINLNNNQILFRIDYFGLVTKMPTLENNPVKLVIDCAYRYYDEFHVDKDTYLIFSLRKQLNRPNGGLVVTDGIILNELVKTIKPSDILIEKCFEIYNKAKMDDTLVGSGLFGNKTILDNFGPRFDEYGGYLIGYDELVFPDKKEVIDQSRNLKERFTAIFNIINKLDIPKEAISIAKAMMSNDVDFPTFFPIYINNASELRAHLISCGFNKSLVFWSRFHKSIDYSIFPNSLKLKNNILCINLNIDWRPGDLDCLEAAMKGIFYD